MPRAGICHEAQVPPAKHEGQTEEETKWVGHASIPLDSGKAVQAEQWTEGSVRDQRPLLPGVRGTLRRKSSDVTGEHTFGFLVMQDRLSSGLRAT